VTLAALFATVGADAASQQFTKRASGKLVPSHGALVGAFVDERGHWVDNATAEAGVAGLEAAVGRKLDIDHHYYGWKDTFPSGLEEWDLANGRIPLISWGGTALDPILAGTADGMIRARARALHALRRPVFLRWGWEMNGNWASHDGLHNNDPGRTNGPAKYVAAWRHIHDLFVAEGATNVVWVWSPNGTDVPAAGWNHWTHYYPGDAYVDWVGIDGYNWGSTQSWSSWMSFRTIFEPVYRDYVGRKPIMIAETASAEAGGDKAAWLRDARQTIKTGLPGIAALVYFDTAKETAWQVSSSPAAGKAFAGLVGDPFFNTRTVAPARRIASARR
jgi:Glycosyl hydrolase family 26